MIIPSAVELLSEPACLQYIVLSSGQAEQLLKHHQVAVLRLSCPAVLQLLLDILNRSLLVCTGHPDGSNPKMASRWQKDAKQLVNAAQRLVLVGDHLPVISSDQDCSRAGVSRHKHACGLKSMLDWSGPRASRYPTPAVCLLHCSQPGLLEGMSPGHLSVCRLQALCRQPNSWCQWALAPAACL